MADVTAEVLAFFDSAPVLRRWHVRELWGKEGVAALEGLERSGKVIRPPCLAPSRLEVESGPYFVRKGQKLSPQKVTALSLLGGVVVEAARSGLEVKLSPGSWRGFAPVGVLEYGKARCGVWVLGSWEALASQDAEAVAGFLERHGSECGLWALVVEPAYFARARQLLLERLLLPSFWVFALPGSAWLLYDLLVFPLRRAWHLARVLSRHYGAEVKAEEDIGVVGGVTGMLPGGRRVVLVDGVNDVSVVRKLRLHDPRGRARGVYVQAGDKGWGRILLERLGYPPWVRVVVGETVWAAKDGELREVGRDAA